MHRYNPHDLFQLPHFAATKLTPIYATSSIRSFAVGALGIFIPLYIFRIMGIHFPDMVLAARLSSVFLYFALLRVTILIATLPASRFLARFGVRASIFVGNTLLVFHLLTLVFAEKMVWFLLPAALLIGVLIPFYWIPYHLVFVEDGSKRKFGHQIGTIRILEQVSGAIAPLFGGVVITKFGFDALLFISVGLVFFSTLPSMFLVEHKLKMTPPSVRVFHDFFGKKFEKSLLSFFGAGAENAAEGVVWPLFFFLAVQSYLSLGILTSVVFFISIVTLWIAGKFADTKKRSQVLRLGAFSNALLWFAKIFGRSVQSLFGLDIVAKLSRSFMWMPFDVMVYQEALKYEPFEYLTLRELALNVSNLFILLVLAGGTMLGMPISVGFFFAAGGSLLVLLIAERKKKSAA